MSLGPKDPSGFYVVKIDKRLFEKIRSSLPPGVLVEDLGEEVLLRTRSRSSAMKLVKVVKDFTTGPGSVVARRGR